MDYHFIFLTIEKRFEREKKRIKTKSEVTWIQRIKHSSVLFVKLFFFSLVRITINGFTPDFGLTTINRTRKLYYTLNNFNQGNII